MADPSTKLNKRQDILKKALKQKDTAKISSSLGLKYLGQTTYFGMIQMILYQTKSGWLLLKFDFLLMFSSAQEILDYPKIVLDQ